jgi:uncharacterized protein (TIGR02246 family)
MRNWIACTVVSSLVLCLGTVALAQEPSSDEEVLNMLADKWVEAWNQGDIDALAELYTPDADFVGASGEAAKGREAVRQALRDLAATAYKSTQLTVEMTRIRFIKPHLALGDNVWEFTGVPEIERQQAPAKGFSTFVAIKQEGQWVMAAHRSYVPTGSSGGRPRSEYSENVDGLGRSGSSSRKRRRLEAPRR